MIHHQTLPIVADRERFATQLREFGAELLQALPSSASRQDRQLCKDIQRGDGRYSFVTLRRLIALSRRSQNPAHREVLAEMIRSDALTAELPAASMEELFTEETRAQSECDLAQLEFARNPKSPSAIVRLQRAALRQLAHTRRLADRVAAL